MSLEEFLELPYREVDLAQPTEVMPPPHARDICQAVTLSGVVFQPGCYVFKAIANGGRAVRVKDTDSSYTWSTYMYLASLVADDYATPGS